MRDFLPKWKSAATRRSNSARPPQKERPQLQNDEIVRDFLNFRSCQRQKRSNSARLPSKKKLTAKLAAWYRCMLSCLLMRQQKSPATKSDARLYTVLRLSRKNHLRKSKALHLGNVTPLTKSAPRSPNMSDGTRNASLQILFKRFTPSSLFATAARPSRLKVLQRFQQLNFQKWSGPEVFSTF